MRAAACGQHFDPAVVTIFLTLEFGFRAIADHFADSEEDLQDKAEFVISAIGPL